MKQVKVAIIGLGKSGGSIHGKHLKGDPRFRVVAVADPAQLRREAARKEYPGCDAYESYKEFFGREDIDIVINATPSHLHFDIAVDLMENGFNVLQEKPIAPTVEQVDKLGEVIERTGRVFAIFLQSRYAPQFVKVREIIGSGVLGRIICVKIASGIFSRRWDWQSLRENVAGSLYNMGPHSIGQALELLDCYDDMPQVICSMDRTSPYGDAEGFVKMSLCAPNRPLIDIEISSCNAYPLYNYHVLGTNGTLFADRDQIKWKYFKPEETQEDRELIDSFFDENGNPAYCSENLIWYEQALAMKDLLGDSKVDAATYRLYTDVYECLANKTPLPVTLKQVRQQIAVIEAGYAQERK